MQLWAMPMMQTVSKSQITSTVEPFKALDIYHLNLAQVFPFHFKAISADFCLDSPRLDH